jgi:hypothetical protein
VDSNAGTLAGSRMIGRGAGNRRNVKQDPITVLGFPFIDRRAGLQSHGLTQPSTGVVMRFSSDRPKHVTATVQEVLPVSGLAFLTDDDQSTWTLTRSMTGVGLAVLRPGQKLDLTLEHHDEFSVVSGYTPLD